MKPTHRPKTGAAAAVTLCVSVAMLARAGAVLAAEWDDPYLDAAEQREPQTQTLVPSKAFPEGDHTLQLQVLSAATQQPPETILVTISDPAAPREQEQRSREYSGGQAISIDQLPAGTLKVQVSSPAYRDVERMIAIPQDTRLDILLVPLQDIPWTVFVKGRVLDEYHRTPIPDVKVRVDAPVPEGILSHHPPETVTDGEGRFVAGPLPGPTYPVGVSLDHKEYIGLVGGTSYFPAGWDEDLGDLYLSRLSGIRGQLLDAIGRPLADHIVYLVPADVPYQDRNAVRKAFQGWKDPHGHVQRHRTDAQGTFQCRSLKAGKYTLVFGDLDRDIKAVDLPYGQSIDVQLKKSGAASRR